jgi:DNA-binding response OmpR family regulator
MNEPPGSSIGRVLIVEDTDIVRRLLSILLERRGYDAMAVASGQAALDVADDGFEVVLLDLGLPDMHGLEVCRRLRSREATAGLRIIILSGRDDPRDRRDGLAAGADDFLPKPFTEPELMARLVGPRCRTAQSGRARTSRGLQVTA